MFRLRAIFSVAAVCLHRSVVSVDGHEGLQLGAERSESGERAKNLMPKEFEVLGPFPHVDGGADVLNAFGGIWEAYGHRVRERQHSREASDGSGTATSSGSGSVESSSAVSQPEQAAAETGQNIVDDTGAERAGGLMQTSSIIAQASQARLGLLPRAVEKHGFVLAEQVANSDATVDFELLADQQLEAEAAVGRTAYPSEVAPGGLASWTTLTSNFSDWDGEIKMDFTDLMESAGRQVGGRRMWQEQGAFGWAVGKFSLQKSATVLARCETPFLIDSGNVFHTPDIYKERRAISALNLGAGEHTLAVMALDGGFRCELFEDQPGKLGAEVRKNLTNTADGSNAESPLVLLSDAQISDVVDGMLATDYLSVPVLNTLSEPLRVDKVRLVSAPGGLQLRDMDIAPLAPGQQVPLRLELKRPTSGSVLTCNNESKFSVTIQFSFAHGKNNQVYAPQSRTLTSNCVGAFEGSGGFLVTYPDFDGSVQRAFVAPPNLTQSEGGSCPDGGCPVLLSLHGADVSVDGLGPRTFGYGDGSFPYAAWLIMPTNRWHWGTDWEGQGLDNAIAALRFVRKNLPGLHHDATPKQQQLLEVDNVTEAEQRAKKEGATPRGSAAWLRLRRQRYAPHPARVLLHGHSMGGHGCYLLGAHFPDGLIGMACAAGWSSMQSSHARLLDGTRDGLRHAPLAEHSADLLAANLFGIPFLITYGDQDDNVPPDEPRYMARLVRSFSSFGSAIVLREERGVGHWFNQNTPAVDAFFRHLLHGEGPPAEAAHTAARAAKVVDVAAEVAAAKALADQAEQDAADAVDRARVAREKAQAATSTAQSMDLASASISEHAGVTSPGLGPPPLANTSHVASRRLPGAALPDVSAQRKYRSGGLLGAVYGDANPGGKLDVDSAPLAKTKVHVATRAETLIESERNAIGNKDRFAAKADQKALAASVSTMAAALKVAAIAAVGGRQRNHHVIQLNAKNNRSLTVDYSSVLSVMQKMKVAARPPATEERELPALPPYFEFIVTNPATFGTKGNLQLLQLQAPQAPAKFLVSRQSGAQLQDFQSSTLSLRRHRDAERITQSPGKGEVDASEANKSASEDSTAEVWIVRTYNVRRFRLKHPPIPGVPLPDVLVVDGVEFSGDELGGPNTPNGRHFCQRLSGEGTKWRVCDGTSWASLQRGTPLQGGPLQMAIRRAPACIVHQGAEHDSEKHAVSLANRMYFVSRFMPTVLNGNEVGPDDSAAAKACAYDSNVILLGHAEHNSWTKRLACAFRYVQFLKGGGFELDGERYTAPKTGLLALGGVSAMGSRMHGRRVLLAAGSDEVGLAHAVRSVPISSGQLTPDFGVYGARSSWAGAGGLLAAGFVDHRWTAQADSLQAAFTEPEPPSVGASSSMRSGASMMQRLSTWGVSPKVKDSELLLGPNACEAEELAALRADDDLHAAPGPSPAAGWAGPYTNATSDAPNSSADVLRPSAGSRSAPHGDVPASPGDSSNAVGQESSQASKGPRGGQELGNVKDLGQHAAARAETASVASTSKDQRDRLVPPRDHGNANISPAKSANADYSAPAEADQHASFPPAKSTEESKQAPAKVEKTAKAKADGSIEFPKAKPDETHREVVSRFGKESTVGSPKVDDVGTHEQSKLDKSDKVEPARSEKLPSAQANQSNRIVHRGVNESDTHAEARGYTKAAAAPASTEGTATMSPTIVDESDRSDIAQAEKLAQDVVNKIAQAEAGEKQPSMGDKAAHLTSDDTAKLQPNVSFQPGTAQAGNAARDKTTKDAETKKTMQAKANEHVTRPVADSRSNARAAEVESHKAATMRSAGDEVDKPSPANVGENDSDDLAKVDSHTKRAAAHGETANMDPAQVEESPKSASEKHVMEESKAFKEATESASAVVDESLVGASARSGSGPREGQTDSAATIGPPQTAVHRFPLQGGADVVSAQAAEDVTGVSGTIRAWHTGHTQGSPRRMIRAERSSEGGVVSRHSIMETTAPSSEIFEVPAVSLQDAAWGQ